MQLIILVVYTVLFSITVVNAMSVGWLLMLSVVLEAYCILTYLFTDESMTSFYRLTIIMSALGIIFSVLKLCGVNMTMFF